MAMPDLEAIALDWWGGSYESSAFAGIIAAAGNMAYGTNPPFSVNDFFQMFPKYAGPVTGLTGAEVLGAYLITGLSAPVLPPGAGAIAVGQLVAGDGILNGTFITAYDAGSAQMMISTPLTADNALASLGVIAAPLLPVIVIGLFVNTASATLGQARWLELWPMAMAYYIAHLSTLWLQSEGAPGTPAAAAAQSGLAAGILVAESADGVSASYQALEQEGSWGTLNLTTYGQQIITWAKSLGPTTRYIW
jgi:hypothetical protein